MTGGLGLPWWRHGSKMIPRISCPEESRSLSSGEPYSPAATSTSAPFHAPFRRTTPAPFVSRVASPRNGLTKTAIFSERKNPVQYAVYPMWTVPGAEFPGKMIVLGKLSKVGSHSTPGVEARGSTTKDMAMTDMQATGHEYHSADELVAMFKKLNAISEEMRPWQETKARKEHTDLFGEAICPGEYYFKRRTDHGFLDEVKLSRASMDRFLHALFAGNAQLQYIAEVLQEKRLNEMREALSKVPNPLDRLSTTR